MISNENTQTSMMRTSSIASNSTISDKSKLKDKLKSLKNQVKEYQQSEEFKEYKEELKKEEQNKQSLLSSPTSRNTVMSIWDQDWMDEYFQMRTVTWKWWGKECPWKIPCYEQSHIVGGSSFWFNLKKCEIWCLPNAFAMIFGYYNRRWLYPNLIPWIWVWEAPLKNSYYINKLQSSLNSYLWTECTRPSKDEDNCYGNSNNETWWWWNNFWDFDRIESYLKSRWYNYWPRLAYSGDDDSEYDYRSGRLGNPKNVYNIIKNEVDAWRPIVFGMKAQNYKYTEWNRKCGKVWRHFFVVFWYSTKDNYDDRINVNFWWGKEYSNMNVNLQWSNIYNYNYWIKTLYHNIWYFTFQIR